MSTPAPGAEAVLQIWERGRREHPVDRALTVLSVLTARSRRALAELPLDQRDRLLLQRRAALIGPSLAAIATCRSCGCLVDVSVQPQDAAPAEDSFAVRAAGAEVVVRMPNSLDLAAVATCPDVATARRQLLRRLVGTGGEPGPDDAAAIEAELDRRAGLSGGVIALTCPDCAADWTVEFDVAAFIWREIEILAGRLLRDVDVLARRYGWSERDILALSSDRRRFYLELRIVRDGYLDALAARTLGLAPLLRPVTPSRFEPAGRRLEVLEIAEPAADVPVAEQATSPDPDLTLPPERFGVPEDEPLLAHIEPDPPFQATAQPEALPVSPRIAPEPGADEDTTPIGIAMLAHAVSAERSEPMPAVHDGAVPRADGPAASPVRQSARWQAIEPTFEPEESAPAVVVHIGRIDVRAAEPAPRTSPLPRQAPVQAGRSLADHLLARDRELS